MERKTILELLAHFSPSTSKGPLEADLGNSSDITILLQCFWGVHTEG
jgi:hypothetical protein